MPRAPVAQIPDQLAVFARVFAETGDKVAASISAGAHPNRAMTFAASALANPNVKTAVVEAVRARYAEAGPMALSVLIKFAKNDGDKFCSRELQLTAARDLANRAGYNIKDMRDAEQDAGKDLNEMSPDELRAMLDGTEAELARRAKSIELAPGIDASLSQVVDLEG